MIEGDLIGRRVAAALIDGIVVFLLFVLVGLVTGEADTSGSSASVELDGAPADAGPVAIRTLLRIIDVLSFLYLIGFTVLLTAGKGRQRLGDMAASTAVVRG